MEFPNLNTVCASCSRIDFLPLTCLHCKSVFCKDHLHHHGCILPSEPIIATTPMHPTPKINCGKCGEGISLSSHTPECAGCRRFFCLNHRLPEVHECESLKSAKGPRGGHKSLQVASKVPPNVPSVRGAKNESLGRKVALMKLKQKAKGPSIPLEERVHFYVTSTESELTGAFYFSRAWTIGRCVDFSAELLKIKNENNKPDRPMLVLVSPMDEILDLDVTLESLISSKSVLEADALKLARIPKV